jgi:hypothetical protein
VERIRAARYVPIAAWSALVAAGVAPATACRDIAEFTTGPDEHYEGTVVLGGFVRSGIDENTSLCLTLDSGHLQDTPGSISTSDGRFVSAPLRPIPQVWHDPLSTFNFGDGRRKNLLYVVRPNGPDAGDTSDVMAVVSLMQSNQVEVRLLRGAPEVGPQAAPPSATLAHLFAVFPLDRRPDPCSF